MNYEQKYKEALEKARQLCVYPTTKPFISDLQDLFPELKESEDEKTRKEILSFCQDRKAKYFNDPKYVNIDKWIAWLEKQGEQKHDDKVELRFKIGDWVANKFGDLWHIDSFDKKIYQVSDGKGNYNYFPISKQDEMRLWTIQDAKDGDVLHSPSHRLIWIYKDCEQYYAAVDMNYTTESFNTDWLVIPKDVCPATKDERTILFERMKEAGYEWNADKKELIKL